MATYEELSELGDEDLLRNKISVAAAIKADAILAEVSPSATRLEWARQTLATPFAAGRDLFWAVIAANESASVAAITGAADNTIQTNVDTAVDALFP